ncbi:hypothetical protein AWJ20_4601 [Sugiyamaella lignohabitans]|uniref:N-acetyltransferase domain-containing protein n=1 Tax=Sugiyamaella lignohabitans TaxID=796027 RepID=A0A167CJG0_9ASCO|nr:uncharacterized protein AWJ20_4601 [Sugiyamaella lignohabitans]ANB11779.1 hypothetical protein AWJ20_4601 [Sugiyamaella lignohabitans]
MDSQKVGLELGDDSQIDLKIDLFGDYYLTPLSLNDTQDFCNDFNNTEITQYLRSPRTIPYTLDDAREQIEKMITTKDGTFPFCWGIRDVQRPHSLIGNIVIHISSMVGEMKYVPNPELREVFASFGFYLNPKYQSKGIMTACLKAVIQKIGVERYGIKHYYGECFAGNIGSRKTFEKCGFKYIRTIKDGVVKYNPRQVKDSEVFELVLTGENSLLVL